MRVLMGILGVAAVAWAGLWFVGARAVERELQNVIEDQRAAGIEIAYDTLETVGFPNRLDTNTTGLRLADPARGAEVLAELFSVFALVYKPNHVIAKGQDVVVRGPEGGVAAAGLEASVVLGASSDLPLERVTSFLENTVVSLGLDKLITVDSLQFAVRPTAARPLSYDVVLVGTGVRPTPWARAQIGADPALPEVLEALRIEMTVEIDRPLDRHVTPEALPQVTALSFKRSQIAWGPMEIAIEGRVAIGDDGHPDGRFEVRLADWPQMLALETAPKELRDGAAQSLDLLGQISEDYDVIEVPLSFQKGFMSFGPIPLGPAPRF